MTARQRIIPDPARIQPMGRQPDAGRLCAALHRQERAPLVRRPRRQHRPRRDLLPGAGGDRRHHHAQLRLHQRRWRRSSSSARSSSLPACRSPTTPRSYGVDIDLLTRGAGFGYIGSTITSLIYASLHLHPLRDRSGHHGDGAGDCASACRWPIGYLISARRRHPAGHARHHPHQPLSARGPSRSGSCCTSCRSSRSLCTSPQTFGDWTAFAGAASAHRRRPSICCCSARPPSVVFSLLAQIGEQVDFLRFLPRERRTSEPRGGSRCSAPVPAGSCSARSKLLAGSFLAYLALQHGVPAEHAAEPTQMYLVAFRLCAVAAGRWRWP